jgi:crossover junction endonuclease MUS81
MALILIAPGSKEMVLDYVVERKRMDDLVSSIIDGRFKEQKYRFENCDIKHPIYLVEHYGIGTGSCLLTMPNDRVW